ncbi:MAG: hypothetical protein JEZ14_04920 [Marinilabiliaceae bacterium]|nr:hypothetical protein [Marinilabiliaceae bacterium]
MKKIVTILISCAFMTSLIAQKVYDQSYTWKNEIIEIDLPILDSISIETWNSKTVEMHLSVNVNDNKNNEEYQVKFDQTHERIELSSDFKPRKRNCHEVDVYCRIKVPKGADINVNTISGDIASWSGLGAIHYKTISGFIDLSLSNKVKADIRAKTISGDIYSDLDLEFSGPLKNKVVGAEVDATLNGGGTEIALETISGNVYLRKNKN